MFLWKRGLGCLIAVACPQFEVQLGNDRPVRLLLDTASVGIRVLHDDLAIGPRSSIVVGTTSDNVTFTDGVRLTGVIALYHFQARCSEDTKYPFSVRHFSLMRL